MIIDGRSSHAIGINGTVPAPLIRLKRRQEVRLTVTNDLDEDTSIHWHGLLVPFQMDGVPGRQLPRHRAARDLRLRVPDQAVGHLLVSQPFRACRSSRAITARSSSTRQGADPVAYDREHVIVLSDHSFMHPHYHLPQAEAAGRLFQLPAADARGPAAPAKDQPLSERARLGRDADGPDRHLRRHRVEPTPISSTAMGRRTTGPRCSGPASACGCASSTPSAMTIFNVRIPGLTMTVVAGRRPERAPGRRSTSSRSPSPRPTT